MTTLRILMGAGVILTAITCPWWMATIALASYSVTAFDSEDSDDDDD